MKFIQQIFQDHLLQYSSKRTIAILFSLSALVLIFIFPNHQNFDFALSAMLAFASSALGFSSYEKINNNNNGQETKVNT